MRKININIMKREFINTINNKEGMQREQHIKLNNELINDCLIVSFFESYPADSILFNRGENYII